MTKQICVLFGAGADVPFGIGTGGSFAKSVLGADSSVSPQMNDAIKEYYSKIVPLHDPWYPSFRKHIWKEEDLVKASLRRKNLENNEKKSDDEFKKSFESVIKDIFEKTKLIEQYPSYMGIIDGKFSSLIAPSILGSGRFWQVVSCYCRAYLTIMREILGRDDYHVFLNPTKDLIKETRIISHSKKDRDVYYSVLKDLKSVFNISVVTTNYTFFCEEIAELEPEQIAYVHGRIGLYESPRDLYVYDAELEQFDNEVVFPYLFVQSGVKPIVESKQIKEYFKMVYFMEKADKIVILGYRLNYDDNHLNSIIRSCVKKGIEVTYLSFGINPGEAEDRNVVMQKLKLPSTVTNLIWKEITSANAQDVFADALW